MNETELLDQIEELEAVLHDQHVQLEAALTVLRQIAKGSALTGTELRRLAVEHLERGRVA